MLRRGLVLVLILSLVFCCGFAFASEDNNITLESDNGDTLEIENEAVISDEEDVSATSGGIRNITFSDGYNGYCINLSKDHAEEGSVFTPKDTSHAMNNKYNTPIGNYLKILFVDFYDFATGNADDAAEVIWDFSDRYYLDSSNPITQEILKLADEGRTIPDHGETKKIDDKTMATFDFEVFDPLNDDLQNYFGYKITLSAIDENDTDENSTDENNTNETTDDDQTEEDTIENETEESSEEIQIDEDVSEGNATGLDAKSDGKSVQDISGATGNPILLLILVLASVGIVSINRKD